ncbi:hypothetical protein Vadar_008956 [Vaccinium darrowii]|uniref:Uncharacterized protein n=1 Tax=Vaccinium darrowii TaxID=229202 RepID=A0ACB7X8I5_9ERIC|nr:hypothetical protein Vadar_008956 [Vaccinium darrowii]
MDAEWNLITKKRSGRSVFSRPENVRFTGSADVVSVYVDNLSEDMDAEWLGQIFSKYGRVLDSFIPKKRSKAYQSKFGFVRFNSLREAEEAIADLNVEVAKGNRFLKQDGAHLGKSTGKSYAEAVVGKSGFEPKRIFVDAIGNDWLSRSVVARMKSLSAMDSIRDALHCKGIPQVEVKDMGGLWIILTFPTIELMQAVFGGELSWLNNWIGEVKKWSPDMEKSESNRVDSPAFVEESVDELRSRREVAHEDRSARKSDSLINLDGDACVKESNLELNNGDFAKHNSDELHKGMEMVGFNYCPTDVCLEVGEINDLNSGESNLELNNGDFAKHNSDELHKGMEMVGINYCPTDVCLEEGEINELTIGDFVKHNPEKVVAGSGPSKGFNYCPIDACLEEGEINELNIGDFVKHNPEKVVAGPGPSNYLELSHIQSNHFAFSSLSESGLSTNVGRK